MKTITITITIDNVSLKDWIHSPWKIRPTRWKRRHFRKVAPEFAVYGYVRKIKYIRESANLRGFDLGLREAKDVVDEMIEKGFIKKDP
jgi:hypothetical protein